MKKAIGHIRNLKVTGTEFRYICLLARRWSGLRILLHRSFWECKTRHNFLVPNDQLTEQVRKRVQDLKRWDGARREWARFYMVQGWLLAHRQELVEHGEAYWVLSSGKPWVALDALSGQGLVMEERPVTDLPPTPMFKGKCVVQVPGSDRFHWWLVDPDKPDSDWYPKVGASEELREQFWIWEENAHFIQWRERDSQVKPPSIQSLALHSYLNYQLIPAKEQPVPSLVFGWNKRSPFIRLPEEHETKNKLYVHLWAHGEVVEPNEIDPQDTSSVSIELFADSELVFADWDLGGLAAMVDDIFTEAIFPNLDVKYHRREGFPDIYERFKPVPTRLTPLPSDPMARMVHEAIEQRQITPNPYAGKGFHTDGGLLAFDMDMLSGAPSNLQIWSEQAIELVRHLTSEMPESEWYRVGKGMPGYIQDRRQWLPEILFPRRAKDSNKA